MVGGGVSFNLDKPKYPAVSKEQLVKKVAQQDKEIAELKAVVQQLVNERKK